ncbi:MAG: thiamine pyrophosphate-binding protein [Proteobacteria bacterium]|nr:thiamine pyrophosphate-binding protein [Pseudomonadota bacterium]MDA1059417.1 thiamine pyrophosphate-binding protein [Pseudomonadota bacterium]
MRNGGRILIDSLVAQGVATIFQVPGESFLPVLDALHDTPSIRTITCRHESGAANMAEAWGKLTGRPGVVFVTRGPGACHAAVGVHTAKQDSTPLILFIGQVDRPNLGREAFQEIDVDAMFGWTTKWTTTARSAEELPAIVARAFTESMSGRPGPVAIALPEDILSEMADPKETPRTERAPLMPAAADVEAAVVLLRGASRPLVIAGGTGWQQAESDALVRWARRWQIPVCVTFRRQDRFDNTSPDYIGDLAFAVDPALEETVREADLILALGTRLGDLATKGYTLLEPPHPSQKLIHVFPDGAEFGHVYVPDLAVLSDAGQFATALESCDPPAAPVWKAWSDAKRAAYATSIVPGPHPGGVDMNTIVAVLQDALGPDDIVATDAGNFAQWIQRYYAFRRLGTQVAPTGGAMGYGVPAGIAASLFAPNRRVVAIAGDGGFMMTASELATARRYDVEVTFIVVNNGMFGTIRGHQERYFPGRVSGTDLTNPDFIALGESFGIPSYKVERTAQFGPALEAAGTLKGPALIEIVLDAEALSTRATLSQAREAAQARLAGNPV